MRDFVVWILTVYLIILAARAVLSWFPAQPNTFLASLNSILLGLTEPVLRPVRQIIPAAGMVDVSFIVVFFVILLLRGIIASG